jgi:GTP-binding protein HflX
MSAEQARELANISREIGRQVGLLVDRAGKAAMVLVGDASSIYIPELRRARLGTSRLRGLRLVHTHLQGEKLTQEDLMDLVFLRLDCILALQAGPDGSPGTVQLAHILPPNLEGRTTETFPPTRLDSLNVDVNDLVDGLEEELARTGGELAPEGGRERAVMVSVSTQPRPVQERSLEELGALARTAGLDPAGRVTQRVQSVNPKFILGRGKLADLEVQALQAGAQVILFDQELSPAQMRNLADVTERKILDRTQLILDIFAQRATSRSGKLQVEMAQLEYALPRLVGKSRALSRLAGGIGGRGPGETKLEVDRRRVQDRITRLKKELDKVRARRGHTRQRRAKANVPVVSLVGYTNAGKSTLLNALTGSEVAAEDKLFATLDPVSRRIRFPKEREVVFTDTVGFIRHLPAELKEAFQATLEELDVADVLVHVADASHPEVEEQIDAVRSILEGMSLTDRPMLLVLNKWDRVEEQARQQLRNVYPQGLPLSASRKEGLDRLVEQVLARLGGESAVAGNGAGLDSGVASV